MNFKQNLKNRQISDEGFSNLDRGRFQPYFPSADIEEKFREIARDLGETNVYRQVAPTLRRMFRDFRKTRLDSSWNLNVRNYLEETVQTPPLALQPMPSSQILTSSLPGNTTTAMSNGLTPVENALLSEEEKQIKD